MLEIITRDNAHLYYKELSSMHRLRHVVFKERLGWDLKCVNGLEFDQYDTEDAVYLIHKDSAGEVNACTRLLPTTVPYMLEEIFPHLVEHKPMPKSYFVWETTRFGANTDTAPRNIVGILIAGMLEFGISMGIKNYVSVTDVPIEPLLKRAGWNPQRLGEPQYVGTDSLLPAAAEIYDVNHDLLANVKRKAGLNTHVISNLHQLPNINKEQKVA